MEREVYTVRVTNIEAFREFMYCANAEDKPWINESNLIDSLKGSYTAGVKADFGSAGHAIIEDHERCKTTKGYMWRRFNFTNDQAMPLIKHASEHPYWIREIPMSKLYHTKHFDLIVTGTTDAMEGITLRDTKFKFSNFDVQDFIDSCQYKFYLDMAGLNHLYYDFFRVYGFETIEDCGKARINDCESMLVTTYPGMKDDLHSLLDEFSGFIILKGLEECLTITDAKAKKILAGNPALKSYIKQKGLV